MINDRNLVLVLRNPEKQICAVVASLQNDALFGFPEATEQPNARRADYLCVHPLLRGRGLAGWMLGWLDHLTHKKWGAVPHMAWWFAPPPKLFGPFPSVT